MPSQRIDVHFRICKNKNKFNKNFFFLKQPNPTYFAHEWISLLAFRLFDILVSKHRTLVDHVDVLNPNFIWIQIPFLLVPQKVAHSCVIQVAYQIRHRSVIGLKLKQLLIKTNSFFFLINTHVAEVSCFLESHGSSYVNIASVSN